MRVVYSINARLGGGGIGNIANNAASAIYSANHLALLFVSSNAQTDIPNSLIRQWGFLGRGLKYLGVKDRTDSIYHVESILFDAWTAAQLPHGDVFHGWNGMCLRSLQKAKQRGMITVVERASSHPTTQRQLLLEEYRHWNIRLSLPTRNLKRSLCEFEEADYITVPSAFARNSMIAAGVAEDKLIEIPFGVDLHRFTPATDVPSHPFRVAFLGQVSIRKGIPYLLESWSRLKWSNAELWIVGAATHDIAELRRQWADMRGVKFIAYASDPTHLLQQSDVFVFPSIEEGSALVTYEALACGLPVIATPNAGSVARDGQDGFIIPIRDVDALCDRLQRLRDDEALRKQMGDSARRRAEQFPWTEYQSQLIANYQQVINRS